MRSAHEHQARTRPHDSDRGRCNGAGRAGTDRRGIREHRQTVVPATVSTAVCTIRAFDGHYLSAIGGGGRTTDVIETNRTVASTWETFTIVNSLDGASPPHYGIRTTNGNFLTAVGGGGRTDGRDPQQRDPAPGVGAKFTLVPLATNGTSGWYAIQTIDGRYLTAVNSRRHRKRL